MILEHHPDLSRRYLTLPYIWIEFIKSVQLFAIHSVKPLSNVIYLSTRTLPKLRVIVDRISLLSHVCYTEIGHDRPGAAANVCE